MFRGKTHRGKTYDLCVEVHIEVRLMIHVAKTENLLKEQVTHFNYLRNKIFFLSPL